MAVVDVLIPTYGRRIALAVLLTSLLSQTFRSFRVIVSDQTGDEPGLDAIHEFLAIKRVLQSHGGELLFLKHLPRQGMAEQRQFLLAQADAPYVLYLDDDLILESDVVGRMVGAIKEEPCGFVGCAVIGLSFINDRRPHEQQIQFWEGRVAPEIIRPRTPEWQRYRLHNAANLLHVQQDLNISAEQQRRYRVAWVGGCVLYDAQKLRSIGGFDFWSSLPAGHCGEEVLVQLRMMARYGGCGLIPSGVYHQELCTTVPDRTVNAPEVLELGY